ncbi:MAG: carboxylating nicotinate-nucleotide diphosphorylase [Gammaproteobacteria bacterium]|nr:carboxylating nicotinate-nucleotide diphosphorylase [Gammaproteobacteria bacterium]
MTAIPLPQDIEAVVTLALKEDVGDGDLTAQLLPEDSTAQGQVITRDAAVFCGKAWFNEVFSQLSDAIKITWEVEDGDDLVPNQVLCRFEGPARALVTGERTALNFLQTLSGTATTANRFAKRIKGTRATVRDTRKTLPGLRTAQKYAVACGGCANHRMGLYDAILIKENHIMAAGSITAAVQQAQLVAGEKTQRTGLPVPIEVEVENIEEMEEAILAGAELVLVDNFSIPLLNKAAAANKKHRSLNRSQAMVEASGGITWENARSIADNGGDYIAVGTLTKDLQSVDLSMRFNVDGADSQEPSARVADGTATSGNSMESVAELIRSKNVKR